MSVVSGPDSFSHNFDMGGDTCFMCADKLGDDPWVVWMGPESYLRLHPKCAVRLGQNLIADAREADLMSGALAPGRAIIIAREVMRRQEGLR